MDDSCNEDFKLISIQTSLEAHQVAYLINKYFKVSFKRSDKDLQLKYNEQERASFICFDFYDSHWDCQMFLVSNKCFIETLITKNDDFLFDHHSTQTFYLLKNLKHTDYLIKVEDEMNIFDSAKILKILHQINGIQSASLIDQSLIVNPEYLIFK
ncbi:hypothetical protein SAMN05421540_101383 [Psychroflexus halocasei]|uniref:IPExxxVDY family protein n=1 Tax=Psychroflexus halocasei TaxID=908615 RepID=A0A1H3W1K3_9FLAO|nr:hypothetical protein SAMN05421540_101383 [Psychroflexus halocasei]